MANVIRMDQRAAILGLSRRKWSVRRIARTLCLNRRTVSRYIQEHEKEGKREQDKSKCTIPPPGKPGSKCTIPPAGKLGRKSECEPYKQQVDSWLSGGHSAQRIWQDLVTDYGYEGSYDSVKRYVRRKKAASPRAIWRVETLPGEEAQVDFGTGAWIRVPGQKKRRKSWIFRTVLSCSRGAYTEAVFRQDTETFIRCIENAFRYFGGVTQTLRIDNLRAAVTRADWYEPELNPKVESFCRHYGTVILPCRVRKPEHKGKVENSVKYVKNNALKGREFSSLAEENEFLLNWEKTVADCRIHGTTRQQVGKRFREIEKSALLPLPAGLFPCFQEGQRRVHRDSYVEVDGAYYKVPEEYVGRQVWARWDARTVRVYNRQSEHIMSFAKREKGTFSETLGARGRRTTTMEQDMTYWIRRSAQMGHNCGLWALEVMAEKDERGIRVLQGLAGLKRKHTNQDLDTACELALSQSAFRLKDIRRLLDRPEKQESFTFMDKHPLIRDMAEYTEFLDMLHPEEPIRRAVQ